MEWLDNKPDFPETLQRLLAFGRFGLNNNLKIPSEISLAHESFDQMLLCFCGNLLLKKWRSQYGNLEEVRSLIHKNYWDGDRVEQKEFMRTDEFQVTFSFNELLRFLNLKQGSQNEKRVIEKFRRLMDLHVSFSVNNKDFYQPFVLSFSVSKERNEDTQGSLIIHPLVFYDLLSHITIFEEVFLKKLYAL